MVGVWEVEHKFCGLLSASFYALHKWNTSNDQQNNITTRIIIIFQIFISFTDYFDDDHLNASYKIISLSIKHNRSHDFFFYIIMDWKNQRNLIFYSLKRMTMLMLMLLRLLMIIKVVMMMKMSFWSSFILVLNFFVFYCCI